MKKNYITPEINVIQLEPLCGGGFNFASVHRESLDKECISTFEVVNEDKTKTDFQNLWGESNSERWGDD
ncbi:hypothetical protein [Prevotella sp.]|uniref:hypothetical protein n=1 Tax=Prevotella sp. TaxID=59823 RepID=UPI003FD8EB18